MNTTTGAINIILATTESEFEAAKHLFIAYQKFLGVDLCFQSFDAELMQLQAMYGSPAGALLLAKNNDSYIGCVAFRKKEEGVCEMKRLFVTDDYKHQGIGRLLVKNIIELAAKAGYHKMVLDTLNTLRPALALYQSLGFLQTSAYYPNPLQGVVYMQLTLDEN